MSWRIVIDFAHGICFSGNYAAMENDEAIHLAMRDARDAGVDAPIERILVVRTA